MSKHTQQPITSNFVPQDGDEEFTQQDPNSLENITAVINAGVQVASKFMKSKDSNLNKDDVDPEKLNTEANNNTAHADQVIANRIATKSKVGDQSGR
jgi:hypothetical protein